MSLGVAEQRAGLGAEGIGLDQLGQRHALAPPDDLQEAEAVDRGALEGLGQIALAHATARGRVKIMAGSGLRPDNVGELLAAVPVDEVHSSCAGVGLAPAEGAVRLGFAAKLRRVTDADVVRAFRARIGA